MAQAMPASVAYMFNESELEVLAGQGLIGAIICSENGSIIDCTSDDLEVFGNIFGYVG